MSLPQHKIEEMVALVQRKYPDWVSFSHLAFAEDEVEYKRATVARARDLLSQDELARLLSEEQFDEFVGRLDEIGKDNNLLWRSGDSTACSSPPPLVATLDC